MKRLFLLSLLLLIVCCARDGDYDVRTRLEKWDAEIWNRPYVYGDTLPRIILDSLKTIDHKGLSKGQEAYYNLLWTIANDRTTLKFESDSVISSVVDYYKDSKDYRNYSRALLYKGIARYRMDLGDTTIHSLLKNAEKVYDDNSCQDARLIALIYTYLSSMNAFINNNERSLEYSQKAIVQYGNLKDTNNVALAQCDMVFIFLSLKRSEEAKELVDGLEKVKSTSLHLQQNINGTLATYYKHIGDNRKAIKYAKLDLDKVISYDKPPLYYKIVDLYSKTPDKDSTLKYLSLLSSALADTSNPNEYRYQKEMSEIYNSFGYLKEAGNHLDLAYSSLLDYHQKSYSDQIQKLEKQYDVLKKDLEIEQIRKRDVIYVLIFSLIVIVACFAIYILIQRNKRIIRDSLIQKRESEILHQTDEFVNKLLFVSCKTIPALYSYIDRLNVNTAKPNSDETLSSYNQYKRMKEQIEKQFRKDIEEVITRDTAMSSNSTFQNLSPQEKVVNFLLDKGYTKEEIASILNTSVASIRASISRINQKMSITSAAIPSFSSDN